MRPSKAKSLKKASVPAAAAAPVVAAAARPAHSSKSASGAAAVPANYRIECPAPAALTVDALDYDQLTSQEFYTKYVAQRRPVLLRRFAAGDHPDAAAGEFDRLAQKWLSPAYLRAAAGDTQVRVEWKTETPASKGAATTSFGRGQHDWMTFSDFLAHLEGKPPAGSTHADHSLYLTSQPIPSSPNDGAPLDLCAEPLSSLLADMPLRPKLLAGLTPVQYNCWIGGYRGAPVASAKGDSSSAASAAEASSFGTKSAFHRSVGSTSGLHHDYHDNAYLLLSGHKFFHLYPPNSVPWMYMHGMKPPGDDVDAEDAAEPGCIVHRNGVIEYLPRDEMDETEGKRGQREQMEASAKKKAKQLARQMAEEEEEEEEEEDEADEQDEEASDPEDDADAPSTSSPDESAPSLLDSSDASDRALFASKCAALTTQIQELQTALAKTTAAIKFEPRENDKRRKHLALEQTGLQKKVTALKARLEKAKEEEKERSARVEAERQRAAASKTEDDAMDEEGADGSDDDEDAFPTAEEMEDMRDDYEASEDDEDDSAPMDFDDDDEEEDEDDEDDEDIDPAEKAAWMKFMADAKAKESKKKKAAGKTPPADEEKDSSSNSKKRKAPSASSAPSEANKKAKSFLSASVESISASSSSTPSSVETFPANFSRIDFTRQTRAEIERAFPEYAKRCQPIVVEVKKGDCLYLPASWFHEVFSCSSAEAQAAADAPAKKKGKRATDGDALPPSVHFALNYWFQPPSDVTSFQQPYSADERDGEARYRKYQPRVEQMRLQATKKAQAAAKPKAAAPPAAPAAAPKKGTPPTLAAKPAASSSSKPSAKKKPAKK